MIFVCAVRRARGTRCLAAALIFSILLLSGCGTYVIRRDDDPSPGRSLDARFVGSFVAKVRLTARGAVVLRETPVSIHAQGPVRTLSVVTSEGDASGSFSASAGESLLDFAVHPTGQISVVLASAKTLRLVRLNSRGDLLFSTELRDPEAPHDPEVDLASSPHDDTSLVPFLMRDAARIAPVGEDDVLAIRTGRNTVVAYRFRNEGRGFQRTWRTLVEPGQPVFGRFLINGSYDVIGQLENHVRIALDTDSTGNIAIGVPSGESADAFHAHATYFQEPMAQTHGVLVTRLSSSGIRLGTTAVQTGKTSELHGLRIMGDTVALLGRVFTERRVDGAGWDAYDAMLRWSTGSILQYNVVDVDRGDVLFDMAPAPGGFLATGTTGYTQNPTGASITEDAAPLLVLLGTDGAVQRRITASAGSRHNGIRSIETSSSGWVLGGMDNGPGTHSHDGAPASITADGYVRTLKADAL